MSDAKWTPGGSDAWSKFQNDFNAMTDADIAFVSRTEEAKLEEAEEWLEAVAAWEAAGKPRAIARKGSPSTGEG